jgi:hypothetical protein
MGARRLSGRSRSRPQAGETGNASLGINRLPLVFLFRLLFGLLLFQGLGRFLLGFLFNISAFTHYFSPAFRMIADVVGFFPGFSEEPAVNSDPGRSAAREPPGLIQS